MATFLVFDIETVVDAELPILDGPDTQKLPPPTHHRVICISALLFSGPELVPKRLGIVGKDSDDETVILREFTSLVEQHQPTLVTYNGRGFDLPVIAMRCFRHGIPFVGYYRGRDMRYRFTEAGHFDLMDFLSDYGASRPAKLDVMAKLCGMPGKVGVDGKDVGPLYFKGKIAEIRDYCLCDVVQTSGVFLRVQLLRGAISLETYQKAMRALIELTDAEPRVAPVAEAMDRPRLLLDSASSASDDQSASSDDQDDSDAG